MLTWAKEHKELVGIGVAIAGVVIAIAIFLFSQIPTWYADKDGDGFGDPDTSKLSIWKPSGFVRNGEDCYDGNPKARPGEECYFGKSRGDNSFDYNCDGTSTAAQVAQGSCSNGTANQGWDGKIPACGKTGKWLWDCDRKVEVWIPPRIRIIRETRPEIQKCR